MQATGRLQRVRAARRERPHAVVGGHRPGRGVPRPRPCTPWSATSTSTSTGCRPTGAGSSPSSGARSATSTPTSGREFLVRPRLPMDATSDRLLLGTDLVKDRARLRRRLRRRRRGDRRVQPQRPARPQPRARRRLSTPTPSPMWPAGTTRQAGSRCGLRSLVDQVSRSTTSTLDVDVRRRRGPADRDQHQVHPSGRGGRAHAAGFLVDSMWEAPGGDFLLTLARPYC